jgi:AAA+ ATPase superfamily predicted ATPase
MTSPTSKPSDGNVPAPAPRIADAPSPAAVTVTALAKSPGNSNIPAAPTAASSTAPNRQLSELPKDELENLAEDLGLDATRYKTRQHLVVAIHERRQQIAALDREAMLDVVRWGRRPVTINAGKEQIAQEIGRIKSMRFGGLSHRGLIVLAKLRSIDSADNQTVPWLIRKLKKQEGFFSRLNRKRRSMLGSMVAKIVGESDSNSDYRYLPPAPGSGTSPPADSAQQGSIKDEIEESGLLSGITSRLKKNADQYLNQKLDEIEARIDRKLDEIDRRLAEWRDKEVANRIRILKITLWASVIVGIFSLIYAYVTTVFLPHK